jgi:amino acid transporter
MDGQPHDSSWDNTVSHRGVEASAFLRKRCGFTAIFLKWLQITVGFVTILYFMAGALSYVLSWPELNSNPWLKLAFILVIFWLVTAFNFNGTSWNARLATIGLVGGVSFPASQINLSAVVFQTFQVLLDQGVVVKSRAFILTLGGSGNNLSFLLAMALTVVTYLAMYTLLFLAYCVLKTKRQDVARAYNIPGGKAGGFLVAGAGLIMVVFSMVISFRPPSSITGPSESNYVEILIGSFVVSMIVPHVIFALRPKQKLADGAA